MAPNALTYHYWDDNFRNDEGKTLQECLNLYGTGSQKVHDKDIIMTVIFLSVEKTFGKSWCLICYNKKTGANIPVRLYEDSIRYGPIPK
jgi:hypothetical protein